MIVNGCSKDFEEENPPGPVVISNSVISTYRPHVSANGDTIEINNKKGFVERVTLRSTIVIDDNGVKIHVPNSTLTNNSYLQFKAPEKYRVDILTGAPLNIDIENFKEYIIKKISDYDGIAQNPKPNVYSKGITFEETQLKVSFWVKDFNSKDDYKLIITNEIRKYIEMGE